MTPLELSILIHYYGCANDYRDGDFSAPAVREAIDRFRDELKLLRYAGDDKGRKHPNPRQAYRITERGRVFVEALKKVPLPVQAWIMPEDSQ